MSAAEIIELIEKLPPAEKAEVIAYARKATLPDDEPAIRVISEEKFGQVVPKVFEKHRELLRRLAQ